MCKASHTPVGPQRCSGDARHALAGSLRAVAKLERHREALITATCSGDALPGWGGAVELRRQYLADAEAMSPRVAGVLPFALGDRALVPGRMMLR